MAIWPLQGSPLIVISDLVTPRLEVSHQVFVPVTEYTVAISLAHANIGSYLLLHHNVLAR